MHIVVYNEASWLCPLPKQELKALLEAMFLSVATPEQGLVLHVVRDNAMAKLNAQQMQGHGPTNILSFPAQGASIKVRSLKQNSQDKQPDILVLSVDTLHRECLLYGQEPMEHLVRLLAHGLGHVLGYDHGQEMFALCASMEEEGLRYLQDQGLYFA